MSSADHAFTERRVVITGAAGFLGSHLAERLVGAGAQVVGVDNLITGRLGNLDPLRDNPRFELIEHDVTTPVEIAGPVDYLVHMASPASPIDYARNPLETLKVGAMGTLTMLELAQAKGARFLLASTSEVYGDPLEHPQAEPYWGNVNPVGPRSVYDEAKRYGEALTASFRREGLADTAIVRLFNTYGPRMRPDDGRAVPMFVEQARTGRPITVSGDGTQTRSLCYVSDTIEGVTTLLANGHPGPMNIGNPQEVTIRQLAEEIRRLCGSSSTIQFIPLPADDPRRRRPDITLAHDVLGWTPRTGLLDGLARTIEWADTPPSPRRGSTLAADRT
jgi:dTDP-glucose 4,6-dehydratase